MTNSSAGKMLDRRTLVGSIGSAISIIGVSASRAETPKAFALTSIALYLPDQTMRERGPSTDDLIAYIDKLKAQADATLRASRGIPGCHGAIVVALKPPARSRVWLVSVNKKNQVLLSEALKAPLELLPSPAVTGINAFAINFNANGGDGPAGPPALAMPDEWRQALPHGGMLPDDAVHAVWKD